MVVLLHFAAEAWRNRRIYFHQFRKVGDTSLVDPNHDSGCLSLLLRPGADAASISISLDASLVDPNHDSGCLSLLLRPGTTAASISTSLER